MPARRQPQFSYRVDAIEVDGLDGASNRYQAGTRKSDTDARPRELRNGAPLGRPYEYKAPRPRFALEAIARAEAEHGAPPPDREPPPKPANPGRCQGCGAPLGNVASSRRYCTESCSRASRKARAAERARPQT